MNELLSAERLSELEAARFPGGHICASIPLQPLAHKQPGGSRGGRRALLGSGSLCDSMG